MDCSKVGEYKHDMILDCAYPYIDFLQANLVPCGLALPLSQTMPSSASAAAFTPLALSQTVFLVGLVLE